MREKSNLFQVNGMPLLVPDAQVGMSYEDIDSSDSGRDESGVMHRIPVRYKVVSWAFTYEHLTEEEKQYMENLATALNKRAEEKKSAPANEKSASELFDFLMDD